MSETEISRAAKALSFIPAEDRDLWIRCGMALQAHFGDDARGVWMEWSATSEKFDARVASTQWSSFRSTGITIGTLYFFAESHGWHRDGTGRRERTVPARTRRPDREDERQREKRADQAAKEAQAMMARAEYWPGNRPSWRGDPRPIRVHPYLERKGVGHHGCSVADGRILVPMRDYSRDRIQAVQAIDATGAKKYLPWGSRAAKCVLVIGPRPARTLWWTEGWATGLVTREALCQLGYEDDSVVIAFSSGQLGRMARPRRRAQLVVADHDWWHCVKHKEHRFDQEFSACPLCGARLSMPAGGKSRPSNGTAVLDAARSRNRCGRLLCHLRSAGTSRRIAGNTQANRAPGHPVASEGQGHDLTHEVAPSPWGGSIRLAR